MKGQQLHMSKKKKKKRKTQALPSEDTPTHDQCTTIRRYTYTIPTGAAATPRLASTLPSAYVPTQYRKGSSYRAPRQYTSSRRYTYTMPKWGSSYRAPSQYTTARRYTYTVPKGAAATQRLAGTLPSEDAPTQYLKRGSSCTAPGQHITRRAADHQRNLPSKQPITRPAHQQTHTVLGPCSTSRRRSAYTALAPHSAIRVPLGVIVE